jgi:phosphoribosylanthranilate isomerase
MLIKICGVKDPEIALFAAQLGAKFIGLVFAKQSRRYVDLNQAKEIAQAVKEGGAQPVAVFSECSKEEALYVCLKTGIDIVQVHQSSIELPDQIKRIYVNCREPVGYKEEDFLLFDHAQPGSGVCLDWKNFVPPQGYPWFLAGGLTSENVEEAITLLKPNGIDISSGVEKEGKKDKTLIRAFIEKVKKYE